MNILRDYLNINIKPLSSKDLNREAVDLFFELPYTHFPVLEDSVYIGSIERELCEMASPEESIGDLRFDFNRFFIRDNKAWLDVLEVFAKNETNIVPVLNDENQYIGFYELEDVLQFFNKTPFLNEVGGILVIQKSESDFSMSQIAQIVESNNSKLLGMFISNMDFGKVEITLKINRTEINEIIQTFRRFGYEIISDHQEDNYIETLKQRSDYLDKYLNI